MIVLVLALSGLITVLIAWGTRGITFFSTGTDNEKQARAAALFGIWRWPSEMHKHGEGKTRMKDAVVLGLVLAQRLLRDKTTDYPLVILCCVANAASAILVFLLAELYWGPATALVLFLLVLTSCWPHFIALFGGHICTAQAFFLAAAYVLSLVGTASSSPQLWAYFPAGVFTGLMVFASASSRKYFPFLIAAFLYPYSDGILLGLRRLFHGDVAASRLDHPVIWVIVALAVAGVVTAAGYRSAVNAMYEGRGPKQFSNLIPRSSKFDRDYYLGRAKGPALGLAAGCFGVGLYLLFALNAELPDAFLLSHAIFMGGFLAVVFVFTFPRFGEAIVEYFAYWNLAKVFGHFRLYRNYFEKIGRPISDEMRGAGAKWVVRLFQRFVPFHTLLFVGSVAAMAVLVIRAEESPWVAIFVLLLALSPILVGEFTRGPQIGRSYFPAFLGILFLIGYAISNVEQLLGASGRGELLATLGIAVVGNALWSSWVFLTDILPARMAGARLVQTLQRRGVATLQTYKTPYNDAFVGVMPQSVRAGIEIRYVPTLRDAGAGYMAVPCTSSKAFHMESQVCAIEGGDFTSDPVLNDLLASRKITDYAITSLETFGSSRFWVHESEVTSYRDLILREISAEDRWRGRAWILDMDRLRADLN